MTPIADELLPLQRIYHWEKTRTHSPYLTQPMGGGVTRDYTWGQAVGEARRVAAWLKAQGWPAGTNIALFSKNCAHWIMADFAIWMAGYVSVPLYPTLTAASVRQILEHSQAKAIFIGKLDGWEQMREGIPQGVVHIGTPLSPPHDFATWDDIVGKTAPLAGDVVRAADELATIIYTSGTTGMPKGVMHSFRNFALAASVYEHNYKVTPEERMLSHLPLSHVGERWGIEAGSIRYGYRIFFAESLETFARDLAAAQPTIFGTVPRLWVKFQQGVMSKMPKEKLDRLFRIPIINRIIKKKILTALGLQHARYAVSGAAPMPPDLLTWYRSLGLELLEVYGMTENFAISHGSKPGQGRPGYVGHAYEGVECRIAENGEILVRSPANMLGYYKEPEKTREVLTADGWLHTGDRGALDEQGRLRITGRVKEIFKTSKGKYVAPAPIENRLTSHPAIEAVCVGGAAFPQPCAMVMLSPAAAQQTRAPAERTALEQSLAAHLASVNTALDDHEQLDFLAIVSDQWNVDNGFITPTMKIKRNVVEAAYEPHLAKWYAQKRPVVWM